MKANILLSAVNPISVHGSLSIDIKGLALDSRQVKTGYAFFALQGCKADGNLYIQDALSRGAAMIISSEPPAFMRSNVTYVYVANARKSMAEMAAAFYGYPSRSLSVIGVTGTNGKTTTSGMIRDILQVAGLQPGLIGTIRYEIGDRSIPAQRTTPESLDLQNMFSQMISAGCQSVVMEVSSHGLMQHRVWGIDYDVAIYTNLTQDHLDYHNTEDEYYNAKSLLFRGLTGRDGQYAVINLDDPKGKDLMSVVNEKVKVLSYGIVSADASIRAENLNLSAQGSTFTVTTPWGNFTLNIHLLGRFNIYNALAALAGCAALGVDLKSITTVLESIRSVPGRLEEITGRSGFQVFVDYAHTADALKNVLTTLREITKGRLITVFGCGGDRDRRKRPLMGKIVAQLADYAVLTSDNPRKEKPSEIIAEISAGFAGCENYEIVEDRREAIARSLSLARKGDIVLVAGKGHENYQEFADTVIPFDDRQVVRECLGVN